MIIVYVNCQLVLPDNVRGHHNCQHNLSTRNDIRLCFPLPGNRTVKFLGVYYVNYEFEKKKQDSENTSWEGSLVARLWIFFHIWKIAKFLDDKIKSAKSFICKEILLRVTFLFVTRPILL